MRVPEGVPSDTRDLRLVTARPKHAPLKVLGTERHSRMRVGKKVRVSSEAAEGSKKKRGIRKRIRRGMGGAKKEAMRRFVTRWDTPEIWMRHTFKIPKEELADFTVNIHHRGNCEAYINGQLAAEGKFGCSDYNDVTLPEPPQGDTATGRQCNCRPLRGVIRWIRRALHRRGNDRSSSRCSHSGEGDLTPARRGCTLRR